MCGRFTLTASGEELAEEFGLAEPPEVVSRYNIAPTQPILVVVVRSSRQSRSSLIDDGPLRGPVEARTSGRRAEWMKWGIAFPPAKGRLTPLLINARAETLGERPAWKDALWRRRCLIPADGFYEWKGEEGRKQPYHVARPDRRPFAFAGLWQPRFTPDGEATCTIVTTAPLAPLADLHDRMPVLLAPEGRSLWLDEDADRESVVKLLLTPSLPDLVVHTVGPLVNNANNEDPACRQPWAPSAEPARGQLSLIDPRRR